MNNRQDIINKILEEYPTSREFARVIGEDPADIMRWRKGIIKIKARAVIAICRFHPEIKAFDLNPLCFPADLILKFGSTKNE